MKTTKLRNYRESLLALGRRMGGDFDHVREEALRPAGGEASGNLSSLPMHFADQGNDQFEREVSLTLLENEGNMLEQIKGALERIEDGTFGRCEECQRTIPTDRLQAVPYTSLCVNCARALEEEVF